MSKLFLRLFVVIMITFSLSGCLNDGYYYGNFDRPSYNQSYRGGGYSGHHAPSYMFSNGRQDHGHRSNGRQDHGYRSGGHQDGGHRSGHGGRH